MPSESRVPTLKRYGPVLVSAGASLLLLFIVAGDGSLQETMAFQVGLRLSRALTGFALRPWTLSPAGELEFAILGPGLLPGVFLGTVRQYGDWRWFMGAAPIFLAFAAVMLVWIPMSIIGVGMILDNSFPFLFGSVPYAVVGFLIGRRFSRT